MWDLLDIATFAKVFQRTKVIFYSMVDVPPIFRTKKVSQTSFQRGRTFPFERCIPDTSTPNAGTLPATFIETLFFELVVLLSF